MTPWQSIERKFLSIASFVHKRAAIAFKIATDRSAAECNTSLGLELLMQEDRTSHFHPAAQKCVTIGIVNRCVVAFEASGNFCVDETDLAKGYEVLRRFTADRCSFVPIPFMRTKIHAAPDLRSLAIDSAFVPVRCRRILDFLKPAPGVLEIAADACTSKNDWAVRLKVLVQKNTPTDYCAATKDRGSVFVGGLTFPVPKYCLVTFQTPANIGIDKVHAVLGLKNIPRPPSSCCL